MYTAPYGNIIGNSMGNVYVYGVRIFVCIGMWLYIYIYMSMVYANVNVSK